MKYNIEKNIAYIKEHVPCDRLEQYNKQIRAEVIEEFIDKFIRRTQLRQMTKAECIKAMYDIAEELKENK